MNIVEKVRNEMEKFIIDSIQDMIDNDKFETIYELEKYKFGQYKLKLGYDRVDVNAGSIYFTFPKYTKTEYRKTFLNIPYGKKIEIKKITKIGEKIKEFENAMNYHNELKKNQDLIDYLPDDVKKEIKREHFLTKITKKD